MGFTNYNKGRTRKGLTGLVFQVLRKRRLRMEMMTVFRYKMRLLETGFEAIISHDYRKLNKEKAICLTGRLIYPKYKV